MNRLCFAPLLAALLVGQEGALMLHAFKRTAASWELRRAKKFLYGNSNEQLAERQFYASIIPQGRGSILDVGANAGAKNGNIPTLC
jgi:hypothetical protein